MNNSKNCCEIELSILMVILLHLLPGIIMLLLALVFSNPIIGINFPILLSLMLAIAFGLIPMELGIIKYFAWKSNNLNGKCGEIHIIFSLIGLELTDLMLAVLNFSN